MAVRTGGEISGLAVMSLTGGDRLGRVHDVVFQTATGHVTGFLVDTGGLLSKPKFLPVDQVRSLGTDALTLAEAGVLGSAPADLEAVEGRTLSGRVVMNESGTALGKVTDFLLDPEALSVPALVVATGFLDNALHGRPSLPLSLIRTIGKDSLVVADSYDPKSTESHASPS